MSYYLEHEGSEHLRVLQDTLNTWAREDQDIYFVSKVGKWKIDNNSIFSKSFRKVTEFTPANVSSVSSRHPSHLSSLLLPLCPWYQVPHIFVVLHVVL